jgi:hypothetical protein
MIGYFIGPIYTIFCLQYGSKIIQFWQKIENSGKFVIFWEFFKEFFLFEVFFIRSEIIHETLTKNPGDNCNFSPFSIFGQNLKRLV